MGREVYGDLSTLKLAQSLGLTVVGEGVENLPTLQRLTALGCDLAQGFYIGKPMPPEEVSPYLESLSIELQAQLTAGYLVAAGQGKR